MRARLVTSGLLALSLLHLAPGGCDRRPAPATLEQAALAPTPGEPMPGARPHVRGVTLDARTPPDDSTLVRLRDLGATLVSVVPFAFQPAPDTPLLRMNPDAGWYSESDAGIRTLARQADALGMKLFLKPHVWIGGWEENTTPARIGFETEAEWRRWEATYRTFILHYARLSEEIGAPLFSVGTELARAAKERPGFWRGLIREVRGVYSGRLTYAANWYDEYEHVAFWPELDYVGVQAYFPLSTEPGPSPAALRQGWAPHRKGLIAVARHAGRPVLFTEIGYRSVGYAAEEPWRWPARDEDAEPDPALQADLYRAFFETLWNEPYFAGAVVWKLYPYASDHRDRWALDFTPQGKPAEQVIREAFAPHPVAVNQR